MDDLKTKSLHAGRLWPRIGGAITTPIFQSSTFEYHGEDYHDVGYIRLSTTPNHVVLGERIAAPTTPRLALLPGAEWRPSPRQYSPCCPPVITS